MVRANFNLTRVEAAVGSALTRVSRLGFLGEGYVMSGRAHTKYFRAVLIIVLI
jgi:hypothetical protein